MTAYVLHCETGIVKAEGQDIPEEPEAEPAHQAAPQPSPQE